MKRLAALGLVTSLAILAGPAPVARAGEPAEPPAGLSLHVRVTGLSPADRPGDSILHLRVEGDAPPGPWTVAVAIPGRPELELDAGTVSAGQKILRIVVPAVDRETEARIVATSGDATVASSVRLRPLRPWRVFIVQHTHTDMGYTDLPSRLSVDHIDFIEEALLHCDHTDSLPDDAKFRWTCEATWAVERLLSQRPRSLIDRFLARVKEGRIEVTGMSMNMTDLATEEGVIRSLYPVARLRRLGIPVRAAMQCDVNGYPWALAELLRDAGITGLVGGINVTRSTEPFDFPRAITWESPSGGGVLAWRGEHYMQANFLGLGESHEKTASLLPPYLGKLEAAGYPYDVALLQMAGYYTDNAAPSRRVCDLVRRWNETYSIPRLRIATVSEFFAALGPRPDAPAYRKAWPDWWADGVGSAAVETALAREAQEKTAFGETFLAIARARGDCPDWKATLEEAYLRARLYNEHTFGAAESIDRPFSLNTKLQWAEKSSNVYEANLRATEVRSAALEAMAPGLVRRGEIALVVLNSLGWDRSGPVTVRLSRGLVDEGTPFRLVDAETGREVPYQLGRAERNFREVELVATGVPSLGYRTYRVIPGEDPSFADEAFTVEGATISNGLVRVTLDPGRCAIASIEPEGADGNLVGSVGEHAFNQLVHERIVHEKGRWHLWPAPAGRDPAAFRVEVPPAGELSARAAGPVRRSLVLRAGLPVPEGSALPGAQGSIEITAEVSLYRGLPGVWIENRVKKPEVLESEALYFAYPFAATSPPRADLVGGALVPGADQIPGTAVDWHAIQRWVRFAGEGRDAVWVTRDAPLVQFGGLNTGCYGKDLHLERPLVYSWPVNNYWFTNFLASQRGEFVFRYAVAGGDAAASDAAANRFGREVCQPLDGAFVEGRGEGAPPVRSFLRIEPEDACLVAVKEAEPAPGRTFGLVVRVRNYRTEACEAAVIPLLDAAPGAALRTTILEEPREPLKIADGRVRVPLRPWELATILLEWR